jgi:hypothetical protein
VDLDGDGHTDILSGSYSRQEKSMAGTFHVLYGTKDGTFKKAVELKGTDGEPLIIPADDEERMTDKICTRPFATDWDGDGHLDLVVGNFAGTFFWFKGEGKGKFAPKPEQIKGGDKPLKITGVHSDPFVVDWDGDGDLDLVSGSSDGAVYWADNTAGKGKVPTLKPFQVLVAPAEDEWGKTGATFKPLRETDIKRPTYGVRVWVADINGDGKLDLLVGDSTTLVTPAKGLSDEEMVKKAAEWQKEFEKAQAAMAPVQEAYMKEFREKKDGKEKKELTKEQKEAREKLEKEMRKASEEYSKLYQKRSEFVTEEMTGFVWLYVRK